MTSIVNNVVKQIRIFWRPINIWRVNKKRFFFYLVTMRSVREVRIITERKSTFTYLIAKCCNY